MLKRLALVTIAAVLFALPAFAVDPAPSRSVEARSLYMKAGIGGGYYYLSPKDIQVQDFYRGGATWRGYLEFKAETGLSAMADIGYFSEGNRSSTAPFGTALTIIPITASIAYHFFKDSAFSPFIGGGLGLYNINESDPDLTYFRTTAFGKHIFIGGDLYFSPDTALRAELRQTFIDPVSNAYYYQANFGGLSAMVSLAVEMPVFGPAAAMTPEERVLARQERIYDLAIQEQQNRLNEMELYYRQSAWDADLYRRWHSRDYLYNQINQTKEQLNVAQAKAEEIKNQREQLRRQYLQEKAQLRQQKKDSVIER